MLNQLNRTHCSPTTQAHQKPIIPHNARPLSSSYCLVISAPLSLISSSVPSSSAVPFTLTHVYSSASVHLSSIATLHHDVNLTANTITLALIILDYLTLSDPDAPAWVGLGIGEPSSGSMLGADIVTAEFAAGANDSCTITDRYVPWTAYPLTQPPYPFPLPDDCGISDWELVSCSTIAANGTAVLEV